MKYIAFLRGINVSGHKLIKMERLRELFTSFGFQNVQTYIQSGNVVFDSPLRSSKSVQSKIEKGLADALGFEVPAIIRTRDEIEQIIKVNPFKKEISDPNVRLYITFLNDVPKTELADELKNIDSKGDKFVVSGNNIYVLCMKGYSDTVFSNNFVEKKLKTRSTARNWATTNKVLEMANQKQ